MNTLTPRQFIEILVEKCPSYDEPLPSCPLARLRAEPDVLKRKENVAALGEEEIDELFRQHLLCVCGVCGS
jgi:hypothetical protein